MGVTTEVEQVQEKVAHGVAWEAREFTSALSTVERGTEDGGNLERLVGTEEVLPVPYIVACMIEDFANVLEAVSLNEAGAAAALEALARARTPRLSYL